MTIMSRPLLTLVAVLALLGVTSAGCTSPGAPSEEELEEVLLSYLRESAVTLSENPNRNVEAVEVIEIGESYQQGRQTLWPVKVRVVSGHKGDEEAEYALFRDAFGKLKVLRRVAMVAG
jgi:hypothetical protein